MSYKEAKENSKSEYFVLESTETLLRYRRKGIPLTPRQIEFLKENGNY